MPKNFPDDAKTKYPHIVYDIHEKEYYNTESDLYLSSLLEIEGLGLKPYSKIETPLPDPLPENYFDWPPNPLEQPLKDAMNTVYPDNPTND